MISVSHSCMASCEGAVPSSRRRRSYTVAVGHHRFAEQWLDDRSATAGQFENLARGMRQPRPARMATFEPSLITAAACSADPGTEPAIAAAKRSALCAGTLAAERCSRTSTPGYLWGW